MPLYEYFCGDCETRFDTLVASREKADEVICRECNSGNVRRLVSSFATLGGFDDQIVRGESFTGGGCCGGSCGCSHQA
jgi:putative FmdB family regulatory protein